MTFRPATRTVLLAILLICFANTLPSAFAQAAHSTAFLSQAAQKDDKHNDPRISDQAAFFILPRDQAGPIFPATVFYRGQSAPIQARNSAGLRLRGDRLVLAAMVDTSGYSSAVAQSYQAYLITEVPLRIGAETLRPGAYGFGFVKGDQMVVLDLGGNELFRTPTTREPALSRPTPLQILPNPAAPDTVRLFLGRSFVVLAQPEQPTPG